MSPWYEVKFSDVASAVINGELYNPFTRNSWTAMVVVPGETRAQERRLIIAGPLGDAASDMTDSQRERALQPIIAGMLAEGINEYLVLA